VSDKGWFAVDLDGTLAEYHHWVGEEHIGTPIPAMVTRVRRWIEDGRDVRIFTARVAPASLAVNGVAREFVVGVIEDWCEKHLGCVLPITHEKDLHMIELWDDRCVQVVTNTGLTVTERLAAQA
jgi:hypothetical protein